MEKTNYADRIVGLERVRAGDLMPNESNWRQHPDSQVAALRGVLSEVGWASALLAYRSNGILRLIDGHLRAGLDPDEQVPVLILDVDDAEAEKLLVSIDPLAAMAQADTEALRGLLDRVETADAGLGVLLADLSAQTGPKMGLAHPDDVPEAGEPRTKPGDLWLLGEHRLLCGDATSAADVERVLGGGRAEMVFTDPPYGIDYQAMRRTETIVNDERPASAFAVISGALAPVADAVSMFVCCDWRSLDTIVGALAEVGVSAKACIVWDKQRGVQNLDRFYKQHEFLVYAGPYGGEPTVCGDVWAFPRDFEPDHVTPKPVALVAQAIDAASRPRDLIYDPFLGSGSTVIAAEQTGRRCCGVEVESRYCDVTVARWEAFTGQNAELA